MTILAAQSVTISIQHGDALEFSADVLALKYAEALYGVTRAAAEALDRSGVAVMDRLPPRNGFRLLGTGGALAARHVLFLGIGDLYDFDYEEIRNFCRTVLSVLREQAPGTRSVALTLHGPGYGLDEAEAFRAEVAGILDAIESGAYPPTLERVVIVERDASRAQRLSQLLEEMSAAARMADTTSAETGSGVLQELRSVGASSREKARVFVAMPFAPEFDDLFHYGIQGAVNTAGYLCERADLAAFTGDVIAWVKQRIDSAALLVADLSSANPNVYLEVGYAWGRNVPTVLLARSEGDLKFNVRGQKCLIYKSIRHLEESLSKELATLKAG